MPGAATLDQPGFGEWPPLRTENLTQKNLMILSVMDTSFAELGSTTHAGVAQVVADLSK
jgi:hypothetical protein